MHGRVAFFRFLRGGKDDRARAGSHQSVCGDQRSSGEHFPVVRNARMSTSAIVKGGRPFTCVWIRTAGGEGFFFSAATKLVGLSVKVNEAEQERYARMICHNQD